MLSTTDLSTLASALGGLPILGCRPDSPAGRAGLAYGDVLLAVNDMPTPDWASYLEARGLRPDAMRVEVFRAGLHLHLELELAHAPIDPHQLLVEIVADSLVPLSPPAPSLAAAPVRKPN